MIIEVTDHDIQSGEQANCYSCPVALALVRATGKTACRVEYGVAFIGDIGDQKVRVLLPEEVSRFIMGYDQLIDVTKVRPFAFEINYEN